METNEIKQSRFTEERALFGARDLTVTDTIFDVGESPLKECTNIEIRNSVFRWRYPIWYCDQVVADGCTFWQAARASVWYSNDVTVRNTSVCTPKSFRRCRNLLLENVFFSDADETLWHCSGVKLSNVTFKGNYFAMNSEEITVDGLLLDGKYSFDGVKNAVIRNSRLVTKDAFWNSENVTVSDSFISGEYIGWNAKNLTFINCTIESLQGLCYVQNLRLVNCKLLNTTLAFEYSEVEADIASGVESVFNPKSGTIRAERIGELVIEPDKVDPKKTRIVCSDIAKTSNHPDWSEIF